MSTGLIISALGERLWRGIEAAIPGARTNGGGAERLPGSLNICIPGLSGQRLVTELNAKGVAISAGSACTAKGTSHSHVLLGMGLAKDDAAASVRISLGRANEEKHIDYLLSVLPALAEELRAEFRGETVKPKEC